MRYAMSGSPEDAHALKVAAVKLHAAHLDEAPMQPIDPEADTVVDVRATNPLVRRLPREVA